MKLTHFKCDDCGHIFPLKLRTVVKAAYTVFDNESEKGYGCYHYHIAVCGRCLADARKGEEDT